MLLDPYVHRRFAEPSHDSANYAWVQFQPSGPRAYPYNFAIFASGKKTCKFANLL